MADACTRFAPGAEQRHRTLTAPGALLAQKTVRSHYLLAGACGTAVCASPKARRAELRSGPELWRHRLPATQHTENGLVLAAAQLACGVGVSSGACGRLGARHGAPTN